MGKTNKEWHSRNRMPKKPTTQERIKWHLAHSRNCSCRPIPHGVILLLQAHGIRVPNPKAYTG